MTVMKELGGVIDVRHELEKKRGLWQGRKQWFGNRIRTRWCFPPATRSSSDLRRARLRGKALVLREKD